MATRETGCVAGDGWPAGTPSLRLFGGSGGVVPGPPDGRAAIYGRLGGHTIVVRVWHRRPKGPDAADAAYHPSGVWLSVRVQ